MFYNQELQTPNKTLELLKNSLAFLHSLQPHQHQQWQSSTQLPQWKSFFQQQQSYMAVWSAMVITCLMTPKYRSHHPISAVLCLKSHQACRECSQWWSSVQRVHTNKDSCLSLPRVALYWLMDHIFLWHNTHVLAPHEPCRFCSRPLYISLAFLVLHGLRKIPMFLKLCCMRPMIVWKVSSLLSHWLYKVCCWV